MFISLDKRQAEWVVVAYASGDTSMIAAVEQGLDVHAYTASRMTKVPIDIIKAENKAIGHTSDPEEVLEYRRSIPLLSKMIDAGMWFPRSMSMRQCGKKSNHGLNYDETYRMFALINELTEKEAKFIVDFYHKGYPGIQKWYDWTLKELQRYNRVLVNMFGRPYRFLGHWDKDLWKSAYSYNPQSTVGELVNRGMCDIYYDKRPELGDAEIVQQVHDNILLQIPEDSRFLGEAVLAAKKHLEPVLQWQGREFVIATDMKIGYNLRDMLEVPLVDDGAKLAESMRTTLSEWKKEQGGNAESGRLDHIVS
jgi:DNA polymerase-1